MAAVGTAPRLGRQIPGRTVWETAACGQLFAELPTPTEGSLAGPYRGRVVGLPGFAALPRPLRRLIAVVLPRVRFPWYGKAFDGGAGANVWLTRSGRFQRLGYTVVYTPTGVHLSYDRASNPRWLRGLRAHVRALAPGRYLCRAYHGDTTLVFFTLER